MENEWLLTSCGNHPEVQEDTIGSPNHPEGLTKRSDVHKVQDDLILETIQVQYADAAARPSSCTSKTILLSSDTIYPSRQG